MLHQLLDKAKQADIANLFTSTFAFSEGEKEGELIGCLAAQLAAQIDHHDIICLGTCAADALIACAFFSRLRFSKPVHVYLLGPVAVRTDLQKQGIGQALIQHGLADLQARAVAVVVTYGVPSIYAKVGFQPLAESLLHAPLKLSMPFGWLGQSLTAEPIPVMDGRPLCVKELNHPAYW